MCLARSLVKLPVSSDHFIWHLVTRTVGYVKNHGQELRAHRVFLVKLHRIFTYPRGEKSRLIKFQLYDTVVDVYWYSVGVHNRKAHYTYD